MAGSIAVLVDNREFVRFCPLREGESGLINLTTMLPDQDRAYIEVYFVNGNLREHIHTFHASGIRTGDHKPQIVVSAHVRGGATLTLRVDGELVATEAFSIPAAMRRGRPGPWIAAAGVTVLLALLGWGILWITRGSGPVEPSGAAAAASGPGAVVEPEAEPLDDTALPADPPPLPDDRTLYFTPESADLIPETRARLDATAVAIAEWVAAGGDPARLTVTAIGHTALYDTKASRLELSRERAQAAAAYLESRLQELGSIGVGIETSGRGGNDPVTREIEAQWLNRRVEIAVHTGASE
ncbi:MAG: OmpA family protein [Spirochaetota bacterium]